MCASPPAKPAPGAFLRVLQRPSRQSSPAAETVAFLADDAVLERHARIVFGEPALAVWEPFSVKRAGRFLAVVGLFLFTSPCDLVGKCVQLAVQSHNVFRRGPERELG